MTKSFKDMNPTERLHFLYEKIKGLSKHPALRAIEERFSKEEKDAWLVIKKIANVQTSLSNLERAGGTPESDERLMRDCKENLRKARAAFAVLNNDEHQVAHFVKGLNHYAYMVNGTALALNRDPELRTHLPDSPRAGWNQSLD